MTVNILHTRAMDAAEVAFMCRMRGQNERARTHFLEAFELEKEAAMRLEDDLQAEPTRSVLFRSAASLAMNAGDFYNAEKMIAMGLSGEPPAEIADELRDLMLDLYLQRRPHEGVVRLKEDAERIVLTGRLGYADETRRRIRLVNDEGKKERYVLEIEDADMTDLIQQFWGKRVRVEGLTWKQSRHISVEEIEALEG